MCKQDKLRGQLRLVLSHNPLQSPCYHFRKQFTARRLQMIIIRKKAVGENCRVMAIEVGSVMLCNDAATAVKMLPVALRGYSVDIRLPDGRLYKYQFNVV